ncbi:cupin domain-containing protein [Phormidium pseudopriestleyi FRX01]|uniref:Cupin domain-containing protein n=1 Tax=Phormidium pseudopriestleyi FRX01 TaxID=1759528 RepID=A0ABS3FST9_9CYAN|nr:cupin domain-containing protein [Phormidium pseudopriestleyi]MBO0350191.1 cupin domain-containing protein [Phormidium pseudopriestleyi FRX01]
MKITALTHLTSESVSHNPAIQKKVMLKAGELPHLTNFSQAKFAPGQVAAAHAHGDMCEVFFVSQGSGLIRVNGTDYPIESGTCIAIEPGEVHEVVNNSSQDLILTYFGLKVASI